MTNTLLRTATEPVYVDIYEDCGAVIIQTQN
jgi:hypothetical protein